MPSDSLIVKPRAQRLLTCICRKSYQNGPAAISFVAEFAPPLPGEFGAPRFGQHEPCALGSNDYIGAHEHPLRFRSYNQHRRHLVSVVEPEVEVSDSCQTEHQVRSLSTV